MKKWVEAHLEWIPYTNGGRRVVVPNDTTRYCPRIVFTDYQTEGAWSADIQVRTVESISSEKRTSKIDLSYLVDNAPFELLRPDASFELYEGARLVATGKVIKEKSN